MLKSVILFAILLSTSASFARVRLVCRQDNKRLQIEIGNVPPNEKMAKADLTATQMKNGVLDMASSVRGTTYVEVTTAKKAILYETLEGGEEASLTYADAGGDAQTSFLQARVQGVGFPSIDLRNCRHL